MSNFRRYFQPGQTVFLTAVTHRRWPWLESKRAKAALLDAMRGVKRHHRFRNKRYVILDDHFHWLLAPEGDASVSRIVSGAKRNFTCFLKQSGAGARQVWLPRFWDHIIRDPGDFERHLDYIHFNPVKHGYVRMACQYRWSSFHSWVARNVYPKTWGVEEPESLRGLDLE